MAPQWRQAFGGAWQLEGNDVVEANPSTDGPNGRCPAGMVDVQGNMRTHALMDELQQTTCTWWISRTFPERCASFDRERWLSISHTLPVVSLHFCIDRFEYPNLRGQYPIILVTWDEAQARCESAGKRLCTETEWTFACEGEEAMPYPNGYKRDAEACVIDRPWRSVDERALVPRDGLAAMHEIARLWQGSRSGAHPNCRSPFGVQDMIGNVDEWTRSSVVGERPSVLKGGYWGPVRTRCRPSTRAHDRSFAFYQAGFRCCEDVHSP
jgi:sulfatase modifying factor 1